LSGADSEQTDLSFKLLEGAQTCKHHHDAVPHWACSVWAAIRPDLVAVPLFARRASSPNGRPSGFSCEPWASTLLRAGKVRGSCAASEVDFLNTSITSGCSIENVVRSRCPSFIQLTRSSALSECCIFGTLNPKP
jgi:hypothetical protein